MDLIALHIICGLISTAVQMSATVIVLFCVINFFSFKPGGSVKFFYLSITYFFSSWVFLIAGALWLKYLTGHFYLLVGVSALLMAAVIHFFYGALIIALYIRTVILQ